MTQPGPQLASALNALQGQISTATTKTLKEANDLVKVAKAQEYAITIHNHGFCHWKEICSVTWTDSAQGDRPDGGSTGGYISGFGKSENIGRGEWTEISLTSWNTAKLPRVAKSSLAAEIQEACIAEDEQYLIRLMWAEINGIDSQDPDLAVNEVPSVLVTDAKANMMPLSQRLRHWD